MTSPFDALRARQCDVVTTQQVLHFVTEGHVRAQLAADRWRAPHSGVLILHNGPPTPAQRTWSALLAAPPGSALAGLTAARWDGLRGFERADERIVVVIPQGQRRPDIGDATIWWSSRLGPRDVLPDVEPRRTRLPRSLLDAARTQPHARMARALVLGGVQQRLVRPDDLREHLAGRGPCRHHAVIVESILDAEGGMQSVPEREFDQIVRGRGLPAPERQAVVRGPDGRYYLDADWPTYGIGAEVHGMPHRDRWEQDLQRHNEVTSRGRRLLHFISYAIRHESPGVGRLLFDTFLTAGWRP